MLSTFPVAVAVDDKSNLRMQECSWQSQGELCELKASLFFLPISKF